jgi:Zn-dependent peptidase ImmA (M78 family)
MKRKPENERFADAFAMHFLMPSDGVQRRFHNTYQQKGDVNVGDVLRIADYYGVSLMAMVLRLESLGLIKRGSWDAIKDSGARVQDIRAASGVKEAEEKSSTEIFPDRYLILAVEAWSSQTITTSQFAKLIRRPIIEARDFGQKLSQQTDDMESVISLSLGDSLVHKEQPRA